VNPRLDVIDGLRADLIQDGFTQRDTWAEGEGNPMTNSPEMNPLYRGVKLLHDPLRNKGTAFTEKEREALGLRGLLPPRVHTQEAQVQRVLGNIRSKATDLDRYLFLMGLQDRNETLFYRVVLDNIEEMMPLIYTPTVGAACQQYGHIYMRSRGLYISLEDSGRMRELLGNWPHREVRVIVVTDGQRILGLGDLGVAGMGIPVGKLSLYTACGGIHPKHCLPITLDVGTDNEKLLEDPLYLGLKRRRVYGAEYDAFIEELIEVTKEVFPNVLIQLEDFGNANAFRLLEKYRERACLFDDDIQGTGSVTLAGLYSALRMAGQSLREQRVLFLGAGEAAIGIGNLIVAAMIDDGISEEDARKRCWFFDSHGLVVAERTDLAPHKLPFAHSHSRIESFQAAVEEFAPTAILGVSAQPGTFDQGVVEAMARLNARPIIFALSNPTSKSECSAEQAYAWSQGRAIFASGSPFAPVHFGGRSFAPGQANNAYIFPGLGLGVVASRARRVTDEMFFEAAKALARQVSEADLELGRIFPPLSQIREVSLRIAQAVAEVAFRSGLADEKRPDDLREFIRTQMFEPNYRSYV